MFGKLLKAIRQANPFGGGGKKQFSSSQMSFDLYYQLSYMATIAASGVPRDQIFRRAAELECSAGVYFKRVELAKERLKYDYARACRAIGQERAASFLDRRAALYHDLKELSEDYPFIVGSAGDLSSADKN